MVNVNRRLVLAIVLAFLGSCACDCPDGFIVHHNSCYKTFSQLANWQEAQTYCQAYGGYLIEIADESEEHFITGHLQRLGKGYFNVGMFWLGGTDSDREGTWMWQATGGPITTTYWKAGEPNNAGSGENCVQLSFNDNFLWNDMPCSARLNFICETTQHSLIWDGIKGTNGFICQDGFADTEITKEDETVFPDQNVSVAQDDPGCTSDAYGCTVDSRYLDLKETRQIASR